jgi:hypothetical protein
MNVGEPDVHESYTLRRFFFWNWVTNILLYGVKLGWHGVVLSVMNWPWVASLLVLIAMNIWKIAWFQLEQGGIWDPSACCPVLYFMSFLLYMSLCAFLYIASAYDWDEPRDDNVDGIFWMTGFVFMSCEAGLCYLSALYDPIPDPIPDPRLYRPPPQRHPRRVPQPVPPTALVLVRMGGVVDPCVICMEALSADVDCAHTEHCSALESHVFHSICLRRWQTSSRDLRCPICRT